MIIRELDQGPVAGAGEKLVIPEGFRITQIAASVPARGHAASARTRPRSPRRRPAGLGPPQMEGFLFPATYDVRQHEKPPTLIDQQQAAFQDAFSQVDMSYARSKNLTTTTC